MQDPDLSITAKAIYAYFVAFQVMVIVPFLADLKYLMTYLYVKMLIISTLLTKDQGYILVQQSRLNGTVFSNNIYTLVSNPKKFCESFKDKSNLWLIIG